MLHITSAHPTGHTGPGQAAVSSAAAPKFSAPAIRASNLRPSPSTKLQQPCTWQKIQLQQSGPATTNRRSLLYLASLIPAAQQIVPLPAEASRLSQDPRLQPVKDFWQYLVVYLQQQQLSQAFSPNLAFYGPSEILPAGTPGDPAAEYNKQAARACGPLRSGFEQPYALCPGVPGALAEDDKARDCCRHFAFAVPRSRYAFAAIDRQTTVVASPRLALAAPATWQGILVHEMGHCIDFHCFPQRYQLPAEPTPQSTAAVAALVAIDAQEADAELRADLMANALLAPLLGQQLCYNSRTRVQSLVPPSTVCVPDELTSSSDDPPAALYMQHFPHPPVSRSS